ncbi:hypothetical protein LTR08_004893 [Meristemomyces frigidus]|nr:hypothetical protein LTR08_004893 [Meristemomyces frigidus]
MLPPRSLPIRRHTFSSLPALSSTSTLLRPTPTLTPLSTPALTRSFWGWRRRGDDYTSHLDPLYQRFARHRTLKTRAALLDKVKRRGKFDWDHAQTPYFTPKHIRWASHCNGRSGPPWQRSTYDKYGDKVPKPRAGEAEAGKEDARYELSAREREWKERLEGMRQKINQDPYEAVFGKRFEPFEPFWGPLVPGWMRGELQESPKEQAKTKSGPKSGQTPKPATATPAPAPPKDRMEKLQTALEATYEQAQQRLNAANKSALRSPQPVQGVPGHSHSSYSTTSWDSWTNKSRRTEWDSTSGQTRRSEYDPISNRMVQIESPKLVGTAEPKQVNLDSSDAPALSASLPIMNSPSDVTSAINTQASSHPKALQIPVKTWSPVVAARVRPVEKAAAMPAATIVSATIKDAAKQAASKQASSSPSTPPPRPAALANLPTSDLDLLTADAVRAKMGKMKTTHKPKPATPAEKAAMESAFDNNSNNTSASDAETDAILLERELAKYTTRLSSATEWTKPAPMPERKTERLQTSLDRASRSTGVLQPAVERMQSRELVELDDSAAHESTEAIERPSSSSVPQGWSKQADLLQADRVKRTTGSSGNIKRLHLPVMTRWIDDMNAAKAAYEASQQALPTPAPSAESVKLAKANKMLEAEVQEQKSRMQAHEGRQMNSDSRQELDKAYRQSAVHGEKDVESIGYLEAEVAKADSAGGGGQGKDAESVEPLRGEGDFCANVTKYAGSERWYKQPSFAAPAPAQPVPQQHLSQSKAGRFEAEKAEQEARDQRLVKEVREIYENAYGAIEVGERQVAGAASLGIDPFDSRRKGKVGVEVQSHVPLDEALKEYEKKRPYGFQKSDGEALERELAQTPSRRFEAEKAAQKARDQALVEEIREIYENAYGAIEAGEPQVAVAEAAGVGVEVDGDSKLGDALAVYERKQGGAYGYRKEDGEALEKELVARAKGTGGGGVSAAERRHYAFRKSDTEDLVRELGAKAKAMRGDGVSAAERRHYAFRKSDTEDLVRELGAQAKAIRGDELPLAERSRYAFRKSDREDLQKQLAAQAKAISHAQLAAREKAAHEAQALMAPDVAAKKAATSAIAPMASMPTTPEPAPTQPAEPSVQWADPPLYKVLAYDSGNDRLTTATTTANFTGSESPISIPQALSQLYQPARFVPHFAELQQGGYQVIFGTRDLLVFKKVQTAEPVVPAVETSAMDDGGVSMMDHGLVKPKENELAQEAAHYYGLYKPAPRAYDPTSVENGQLMPYENAVAQEAAHAYDAHRVARGLAHAINPVDGTTGPAGAAPEAEVSTGLFASPTGFVNYESFSPRGEAEGEKKKKTDGAAAAPRDSAAAATGAHAAKSAIPERDAEPAANAAASPRVVRREEVVFSGTRRKWNDKAERHHQRSQRHGSSQRKASEGRRGGAVTWALSVGVGAAALTYGIGVATEASRQERVERERWAQVVESRRGRWG